MLQNTINVAMGKNTTNNESRDMDSYVTSRNNIVFRYQYGYEVVKGMKWLLYLYIIMDTTILYK